MKEIMKFEELPIKDRISYYVAIGMISSGVLLAFLSFFLNAFNIATGVLIYIAQCFVIGGGLVGANVYFKSKWVEFDTRAKNEIQRQIEQLKQQVFIQINILFSVCSLIHKKVNKRFFVYIYIKRKDE